MFKTLFKVLCLWCICNITYAYEEQPLRVAVPHFLPPYVIEGANKKLSGFDISLIANLCAKIGRRCVFLPMAISDVIPAIARNEADLGIGAMTITLERYQYVNFTIPYMLSESRFIGKKSLDSSTFDLNKFKDQKIGIQKGGVQRQELKLLNIKNDNIVSFVSTNNIIDALNNDEITLALIANPVAIYWQNYSSNTIHTLGKPLTYGLGVGIAVNKNLPILAKQIDNAILLFQQTQIYNQLYQMYFGGI